MLNSHISRREFVGASALNMMAGIAVSTLADPARAAAQSTGIKKSDLPDLTIKQVKVYVLKSDEQVASVVTNSGIEGNYTLATRYWHPNWSNLGWLDYAKPLLAGKSVLDLPSLTS